MLGAQACRHGAHVVAYCWADADTFQPLLAVQVRQSLVPFDIFLDRFVPDPVKG